MKGAAIKMRAGTSRRPFCTGLEPMRPGRALWLAVWPATALSLAMLSGCQTHLAPATYSPDYQALTRAGGRVELIPVECLKPPPEYQFEADEGHRVPLLPPGCANNLTLLQMVEQRSDLMQGRVSGPTMAAPVGRAAQVYIDGYDREELRRRESQQQAQADKQENQ